MSVWKLAVPKSIEVNSATKAWQSGRVQDVIDFADGSVLIGTNSGDIWWASKTGESRPLSDWEDPDITSVERGPFGQFHVYVSSTRGLYENQSAQLDGFQRINMPQGPSIVRDIGILRGAWRIVIGCDNGLFWSAVPPPGAPRVYNWQQATGTGATTAIRSVSTRSAGAFWSNIEDPTNHRLANREIAVISRGPVNRDVFWISSSGDVMTTWNVLGGAVSTFIHFGIQVDS